MLLGLNKLILGANATSDNGTVVFTGPSVIAITTDLKTIQKLPQSEGVNWTCLTDTPTGGVLAFGKGIYSTSENGTDWYPGSFTDATFEPTCAFTLNSTYRIYDGDRVIVAQKYMGRPNNWNTEADLAVALAFVPSSPTVLMSSNSVSNVSNYIYASSDFGESFTRMGNTGNFPQTGIATDGANHACVSTSGRMWHLLTSSATVNPSAIDGSADVVTKHFSSVAYGKGKFVACGHDLTSGEGLIVTGNSTGNSFVTKHIMSGVHWTRIKYANGIWVVIGETKMAISHDAEQWNIIETGVPFTDLLTIKNKWTVSPPDPAPLTNELIVNYKVGS